MFLLSTLLLNALGAFAYPVTYTSCGIDHSVAGSPQRVVTMNQGATELMFALGLASKMAGTAYLDDYIWPKYATEYAKIPVLASGYPNETEIMAVNPDFIVGSYNSAFREVYETDPKVKGIFSTATVGRACTGVYTGVKTTCRPDLHSVGIGTFLFADACEDKNLRPRSVTETTVYQEMRALGRIFSVDVEPLIKDMRNDFDTASSMVTTALSGSSSTQLKAVWLDCVGRCCKDAKGNPDPTQVFVGAGSGAPGMLMAESGMTNAFANKDGNWACVNVTDVVAANPDVFVIVDASWDTALSKLTWLYNHSAFCSMDAMKGARHIQIPFSATTLSPRNGPAARDVAIAALHVRTGSSTTVKESGVSSFDANIFKQHTQNLKCTLEWDKVKYDKNILTDGPPETNAGQQQSKSSILLHVIALLTFYMLSA